MKIIFLVSLSLVAAVVVYDEKAKTLLPVIEELYELWGKNASCVAVKKIILDLKIVNEKKLSGFGNGQSPKCIRDMAQKIYYGRYKVRSVSNETIAETVAKLREL